MRKDTALLTLAIIALGAYLLTRKKAAAPTEEVPVDVVETKKLSANASVTKPKFARGLFRKEWVVNSNVFN